MTFANEKLTLDQREEFSSRGIIDPKLFSSTPLKPHYVTVNSDRNCFLIEVSGDRDYPGGKRFLFIWKDTNYWIQINWLLHNDVWKWVVPAEGDYFISTRFPYDEDPQFLSDLREAFLIFGVNGRSDSKEPVSVEF